jgi:hypothetical protein
MAQPHEDPPVNFSTFLVSLASAALVNLGHVDEAGRNPGPPDLHLARHTLDLIDLLAEKTQGNLDPDEQKLLETLQRELREKYTAAAG